MSIFETDSVAAKSKLVASNLVRQFRNGREFIIGNGIKYAILASEMKALLRVAGVLGFLGTFCGYAATFFSESSAAPGGDGSFEHPWTLQVALTNSGAISPGDILLIREGTHTGLFEVKLYGTVEKPVIIKNYRREQTKIDGQLNLTDSQHVWLWGLEIVDSMKATRTNPFDTIRMGATGTKVINCLIHDCCIGIAPPGVYEAYGNIMWNCGKSSLEHALYYQNDGTAPKTIENNLIGYSSGFGIHCYGSAGQLNNLRILDNAVWASGTPIDPKAEILLGGGQPVIDGLISSNHCYSLGRGVQLGYGVNNSNAVVTGNVLFGSPGFLLNNDIRTLTFANNTVGTAVSLTLGTEMPSVGFGPHAWDRNQYFSRKYNWSSAFAVMSGVNISFSDWRLRTGFDGVSTYVNGSLPDRVEVRPNRYEAKRAHIVVWNWKAAHNVTADVSKVLTPGDTYEVRSAMNYFSGPITSGIYSGQTLQLPMTNLTLAPILYWSAPKVPANISTNFAAFVLIGMSTNRPAPPEDLRVYDSL